MQPIQLFELASRQAQWLTARQGIITANIANANTPGFRAMDVTPFEGVLDQANIPMARTNPGHMVASSTDALGIEVEEDDKANILVSGNSVDLAEQLMKQGSVKRDYDINTSIVKSFNHMMLLTVRK